jgi:hypothetical protein
VKGEMSKGEVVNIIAMWRGESPLKKL